MPVIGVRECWILLHRGHDVGEAPRQMMGGVWIFTSDVGKGHLGEGVNVIVNLRHGSSSARGFPLYWDDRHTRWRTATARLNRTSTRPSRDMQEGWASNDADP